MQNISAFIRLGSTLKCENRHTHTHTYLHDDVKGKVEQQVADGNGQQVGGKVIRSLYEAVGSSAEREQEEDAII